ncbi:MAG: efflux RND transporter periplasmic adaptor subunit [Acidobacteriota bacterium]
MTLSNIRLAPGASTALGPRIAAPLLLAALAFTGCGDEPAPAPEPAAPAATPTSVTSIGRLEPALGVVDVGAAAGDRVLALEVTEGDSVERGQVLVRLQSHAERAAARATQEARRDEALEALERARTAGPLAVRRREAEVERLEAALALARSDLTRTEALVRDGVVPDRDLEHQRTVTVQAAADLEAAGAALDLERSERRLASREARARLATTEADLDRAEAALEQTEILSPVDGTVLDVFTFPGEPTHGGAILRLGETARMMAVAEIFETEARFVRAGQRAKVTSPALPEVLEGTVARVSRIVRKNDVLDIDPAADTDTRVIEARILLDAPQVAARFVHLQVDVEVDVGEGNAGARGGSASP